MSRPPPAPSPASPSRRLRDGVWATLPLVPGVAAFGLVYGVLARQAGLNFWATLGMSALVFAGASQFIAVSMWGQVGGGAIVLTTLTINLRHLLMGASLAPYLRAERGAWKALLAFAMADESYALAVSRYLRGDGSREFFLSHIPAAVFAALLAPPLLAPRGTMDPGVEAAAAIPAAIAARWTRRVPPTILAGLAGYWLIRWLG